MKNVFIIGSRGYTKNYGGWETFVHGLLDNWEDESVHFYIFEITNIENEARIYEVNKYITCIAIFIRQKDNSAMVWFDLKATKYAYAFVKKYRIHNPIFYFLGFRIGPYIFMNKVKFNKAGITILENPAGLEWKRAKWNKIVQIYAKSAAYMMAIASDYLICDSKEMKRIYEKFVKNKKTKMLYISYGCYKSNVLREEKEQVKEFCYKWNIRANDYYLIVGRFTPENNYELMLKGFIEANVDRNLVVICNFKTENQKFYTHIKKLTDFESYPRIKMVGTVYDKELLDWLRCNAIAYIHGHSVGGTNPGLLEAMSATDVNILNDVQFNREVGDDAALYFSTQHQLADLLIEANNMDIKSRNQMGKSAKRRMIDFYSWPFIVDEYRQIFNEIEWNNREIKIDESAYADKR